MMADLLVIPGAMPLGRSRGSRSWVTAEFEPLALRRETVKMTCELMMASSQYTTGIHLVILSITICVDGFHVFFFPQMTMFDEFGGSVFFSMFF